MAMLYQLHNQGQDQFVYTCNNCKSNVETRWHCTVCGDFDLCVKCYPKDGHVHKMQKLGFELRDDSTGGDKKQIHPQESRKLTIQRCILSLEHACQCRDANCRLPSCQKMKRIVSHAKTCKRKGNGSCAICKQLIALNCYHSKNCQENICPVPFCLNIKYKLKQQRMAQQQILKRRIATAHNRIMTEAIRQSSPGSSSQTSQPSPDNKPLTSPHVSQPGIGMKPSACPPVGALQAVQQVQAARQSVPHVVANTRPAMPHMVGPPGSYGNNTMVNNPTANPALILAQQLPQHMQKPMPQMQPGQPNRMMDVRNMGNWDNSNCNQNIQLQGAQPGQPMGLRPQSQMMGANNMPNPTGPAPGPGVALSQVMATPGPSGPGSLPPRNSQQVLLQLLTSLKSSNFPQHKQQVLKILKSNPQLMAAFIKQRSGQQQQLPPQQQQVMNERGMIGQPLPQPRMWQQQQLLAMQRQQLQQQGQPSNQFPQPPMYAQRPRMPYSHQQDFQNEAAQFQQQQRQQLLMSNQQMTSSTHPPNEGAANAKETKEKIVEETKVENKVDFQCKICMDEQVEMVFLPCGHLASCTKCAKRISNCPMCRKRITRKVRTYLS